MDFNFSIYRDQHLEFLPSGPPQFNVLENYDAKLFYKGWANIKWQNLLASLQKGIFPTEIRGNFAFVFQSPRQPTIAAVDHLASIPLYYTNAKIGPLYLDLCRSIPQPTKNEYVEAELQLLNGHTFLNQETLYKEVQRIRPGYFLQGKNQRPYISLNDHTENETDINRAHLCDLMESAVAGQVTQNNVLLTSSGTDSLTLTAILLKLKVAEKFKFVTFYSEHQWISEMPLTQDVYQKLGLPLIKYKIDNLSDAAKQFSTFSQTQSFWFDRYFPAKRAAVSDQKFAGHTVFTGEVGDQLFGGPKLSALLPYASQAARIDPRQIAQLWIHLSVNNSKSSLEKTPYVDWLFEKYPKAPEVYEALVEEISQLFVSFRTRDLINRLTTMNLIIKGPYRVWPYSQDEINYAHPFADWNLVEYCLRLKSKYKVYNNGTLKRILYDLWSEYVPEVVWEKPKGTPRIPDFV